MKKAFNLKFLALGALLMLGNVAANATTRDNTYGPADGTAVGATIKIGDQIGLVTYRVTGWNATNDFYTVKITGFDADGLDALAAARAAGSKVTLRIPVSFEEKFGENKYKYAVTLIDDGQNGDTKQSFYGLTEVDTLIFIDGSTDYNGVTLDKFSYTVGTNIGEGKSFYGCTNMKKLVFTENCTYIAKYSFQNTAIREFEIPKKCATVAEYAFYNCKNLKTVTVASGNTAMHELGNYVFGNSSLQTLDLSNASQLWALTDTPFMYDLSIINDVLKTVKVPASLRQINDAFKNCTALTNIIGFENTNLGDGVANTPTGAPASNHILTTSFNGCRSLTRLDIPSCDVIGSPFVGCVALDTLTFNGSYKNKTIAQTLAANHNLFGDISAANVVAADQAALKVIAFNNDFRGTIEDNAFVGVTALDSVGFKKLTNGATIKAAFTDVTTLNKLTFTGINTYFNATDKDGAVLIDDNAFKNTGITALDFKTINLEGTNKAKFTIDVNAFSDCAALADIKFGDITVKNDAYIEIMGQAFTNNPVLAKVTFANTTITSDGTLNGVRIWDDAFATGNAALTEVAFGNLVNHNGNTGYNGAFVIGWDANIATIGTDGDNNAAVFGDGTHLQKVTFGALEGGFVVSAGAFKSTGLTTVEFGAIQAAKNYATASGFHIGKESFMGGDVSAKTVKFSTIADNGTGATGQLGFVIHVDAFAADSLKTVEIGNISASTVTIDQRAFQGKNLQKVEIGNITAGNLAASAATINQNAFQGGEVAAKTVKIGKIQNATGGNTLSLSFFANAFAADSLASVTIGDMTANSLTIAAQAFEGKALTTVSLGKMTAATLAISGNNAFANVNDEDALTETITIGEIGAGLNITGANVFQGPQEDGSVLNVTIAKLGGAITAIPANTFKAAAKGEANYTITGDVVAGSTVNIAAGAFAGSQENILVPVENTTTVTIKGNYNADFAEGTFTNVNKAIIAVDGTTANEYGVAGGDLGAFAGAKYVTVGNIATGKSIKADATTPANTANIEQITFMKNVADANAIGVFNSANVRKIEFAGVKESGVQVAKNAVAATAFQAAGTDAAAASENISVIYREEQTREAEVIFAQNAFAAAANATTVATLYTTSWAKANVYEAADILDANKQCVYRLGYSESDVAPGEPIIASIVKKEGNTYGYAKLYIPKGVNMKYKVPAKYDATADKNGVQLYYGRIDNSNNKIYMYNLPVIDDYYWIDATDVDQAFVLRTNSDIEPSATITAETVTDEDLATFAAGDPSEYYFFDAALAVQNQLRYNPAEIANQELRNNAEFAGRDVYVMANPKTAAGGFAFAKFNKDATYTKATGDHEVGDLRCLSAKSLYVVGKLNASAPELTVVWEGDEDFDANTTGIETVKAAESNDAIFNLQGVRVSNAQKGIYIMNGKKVVLK